jgi:type I restriction enzyme S subunit
MVFNEELEKEIPKGWEIKALVDIASYINRGVTPNYIEEGGTIVLNQRCVRNNTIDFSFSKRHNASVKKVSEEKHLQLYDIVVNSTGEGTLGRVGLIKEKPDRLTVDTHITIVRSTELIHPLSLWYNLSSRTEEIEKLAEGSTGQTELGRNNLGELRILIPAKNIQDQFVKMMEIVISYSSKIEKEIPINLSMKDLLFSKLATIEN